MAEPCEPVAFWSYTSADDRSSAAHRSQLLTDGLQQRIAYTEITSEGNMIAKGMREGAYRMIGALSAPYGLALLIKSISKRFGR